uniref:Endoplasmic reticulum transmembrane protein n=1 Tax=Meloidogyne hapla TaxID=6305 RepID=A0A1I8B998_MELHA
MTLQWTIIAFILYAEIFVLLILMLPWIRPTMWKKVFNSRIVHSFKNFSNVYAYAFIFVLLLLFVDATREVRKYSHIDLAKEIPSRADADAVIHMRLFSVIRRIVTLLARCAYLELAAEAAMKQAEGAGKAAKDLMDKSDGKETETDKKLREDLKEMNLKLKKAEADRDVMKAQSENLQEEYERVTAELREHEAKNEGTAGGDKKSD